MLNFSKKQDLIILDDYFPNLLTGFRVAEYNYYLSHYKKATVYSNVADFDTLVEDYISIYPEHSKSVQKLKHDSKYNTKLFYTVFLNNAFNFLSIFERNMTPFVFTLYPGGGFWLYNDEVDQKLKAVLSSKYFQKVIVTQSITRDYLLDRKFCKPEQIEFIFGVVTDSEYFKKNTINKSYYLKDKQTFDICFVAHKYMKKGLDKGYDKFIEVAKLLSKNANIRFHVVGGFGPDDIDVSTLKNRIFFYGSRGSNFFPEFYSKMDIILSPTVPHILHPGNFDGFPTGCCTDAALCGVAVFTSDPLKLNTVFENKKEIEIISLEPQQVARNILYYYNNSTKLYTLAINGKRKFEKVYNIRSQMKRRVEIIDNETNK